MYHFPSTSQLYSTLCCSVTQNARKILEVCGCNGLFFQVTGCGISRHQRWPGADRLDFKISNSCQMLRSNRSTCEDPTAGWLHSAPNPHPGGATPYWHEPAACSYCKLFSVCSDIVIFVPLNLSVSFLPLFLSARLIWKHNLHYQVERGARCLIQLDILSQYLFTQFVFRWVGVGGVHRMFDSHC